MIIELSLGLDAKIPNLTTKRIHMPDCGCVLLKVFPTDPEKDILVDLCPLHTEEYKKMTDGTIEPGVLIPGLGIERE